MFCLIWASACICSTFQFELPLNATCKLVLFNSLLDCAPY